MIQFSNTFEATAAIRSTEAIFNNRFIKIYWACQQLQNQPKDQSGPHGGHGGGGGGHKMLGSRGGPGGPGLLPGGPPGFHGRPGPGDQGAGASAGGPVSGPVNFFKSGTNKWAANKQQMYGSGGKGPHFGAGGPLESRLGDGSDSGQGNFYQRKAAAAAAARAAAAAAQHRHHHQQAEVNAHEGSKHPATESSTTSASASASTSTLASLTTTITPVGAPASSGAPLPPPLKIISPLERAIKMKELASASQALSDALANQKKLMGKMEAAKTAKEKGAILKLLQLTLKNVTAMKQRVEKLQTELTPAFRNSKTFNRSNASAKSTTDVSQRNERNVLEEDQQQQEQEQKRAKKRSSEMDDDSNSSGSDSETSSTAFDQRQVAAVKNPANEAENLQEKAEAEAAAAVAVEDDVAQVDFANEFHVFFKKLIPNCLHLIKSRQTTLALVNELAMSCPRSTLLNQLNRAAAAAPTVIPVTSRPR